MEKGIVILIAVVASVALAAIAIYFAFGLARGITAAPRLAVSSISLYPDRIYVDLTTATPKGGTISATLVDSTGTTIATDSVKLNYTSGQVVLTPTTTLTPGQDYRIIIQYVVGTRKAQYETTVTCSP